jgi:hypothetical protein
MKGRNWVAVATSVAAVCVIGLASGVTAGSAASRVRLANVAGASGKAVFSRGIGAVLPTNGKLTEVSVSCPKRSGRVCRGSVALVPRGRTARTLGSRRLARASFRLARGAQADLKLRLSLSARRALSRGPLYVTAVLGAAGSRSPVKIIAKRPVALATGRPFTALTAPRASDPYECGPDYCVDFSWSWTIPAAHYLVMPQFTCPAAHPRLAQGRVPTSYGTDAKIAASASNGTGYAAFDVPALGPKIETDDPNIWFNNMVGWPQGDVLSNNVWAPLFDDGHFKLVATCTDALPLDGSAWMVNPSSRHADEVWYDKFFPWK